MIKIEKPKPKFTPGPWVTHKDQGMRGTGIVANTLIARVYSEAFGDDKNEAANAHLVAAAPMLYENLEKLIEGHTQDVSSEEWHHRMNRAIQSLAKARGEW